MDHQIGGQTLSKVPEVAFSIWGSSGQVWHSSRQGLDYFAAVANTDGPVLAVLNAWREHWLANLPTGPHSYLVATRSGGEARARIGGVTVFAIRN